MNARELPVPRPRQPRDRVIEREPLDFQDFHRRNRGAYVRWAGVVLGSRADAEDAVDEAMLELLSKWPDVARKPSPEAYAWTVVKSRTIDAARARSRRPEAVDLTAFDALAVHTAEDPTDQLLTNMTIQKAVGQLPERQYDVFVLRFSLGYSTRHTADLLAISEATVRSTVRDAKRRLARTLGVALEERIPR